MLKRITHPPRFDNNAATLDELQRRVVQERSTADRASLEHIRNREALLLDKEALLEKETARNEALVATFTALRSQHDVDRVRLKAEHERAQALQRDLLTESTVLRQKLIDDSDRLHRDEARFEQQKTEFMLRLQRAQDAAEHSKEMSERAIKQLGVERDQLAAERSTLLRQLDSERAALSAAKQEFALEQQRQEAAAEALRREQDLHKNRVRFLETRMGELTELGSRVNERSEMVAELYRRAHDELREAEGMRAECLMIKEDADMRMASHDNKKKALDQGHRDLELLRLDALKQSQAVAKQKRLVQKQERALSSAPPQRALMPTAPQARLLQELDDLTQHHSDMRRFLADEGMHEESGSEAGDVDNLLLDYDDISDPHQLSLSDDTAY